MQWQEALPSYPLDTGAGVIVLEGVAGGSRRRHLQEWLDAARSDGVRTWLLPCDSGVEGIWSGLSNWLEDLLPEIERTAPELVTRYDQELTTVLPALRVRVKNSRESLTDRSSSHESVRNYAVDRAYRLCHGIVNLLADVHRLQPQTRWVVCCDDYDHGGALVRRTFQELMRRRGRKLGITLVAAVAPGVGDAVAEAFEPAGGARRVRMEFPADPPVEVSRSEMTRIAKELDERVRNDPLQRELNLARLIRYWSLSERPSRAVAWQAVALGLYSHYGFYEDALAYSEAVLGNLDQMTEEFGLRRWSLVATTYGAHLALGNVDFTFEGLQEVAKQDIWRPDERARLYYMMSMLYVRFLPQKDFAKAEEYVMKALEELERAELPESERHFLTVFILNGLALVRHRQGRPQEAIELSHSGFERLDEHLDPDTHKLHRSVLLYNVAQVYAATKEYEKALESFAGAMEMDPTYSEYYNERGNVYLEMGRYEEAIRDYQEAIRLSAPYPEVWTNLGQCYRQMGRMEDAVEAYSTALDLEPERLLAIVGRAQAYDALGEGELALADYDAALAINPDQSLVLGNRAILLYERGRLEESLADLNRAIELAPKQADLYRNRAFLLREMGEDARALEDLESFLRAAPDSGERAEVEEEVAALRAALPLAPLAV